MTTKPKNFPSDLPSKPLVEAIFEMRWALQAAGIGPGGPQIDPGFRFLLGRYQERIQESYPIARELPAASLPEDMTAYIVRHQFRAGQDAWPVTQLGPGILSVNETSGYKWERFESKVLEAATAVLEAYPKTQGVPDLKLISVMLRYQNAMNYSPQNESPRDYIRNKLHTNLEIDKELFSGPGQVQEPEQITISSLFPLRDLPGEAQLQLSSGTKNNLPSIILDIAVRTRGNSTPADVIGLKSWLELAHEITESWFFTLCRGELRESFERNP